MEQGTAPEHRGAAPETVKRKITYRVGWKSGSIEVDETVRKNALARSAQQTLLQKAANRYVLPLWRPLPLLPGKLLLPMVILLPVIGFIATLMLSYLLLQ
ncbi:hypothetical protein [Paenibacillus turpanensis]|uniref:hypothetical protein n=1 Tax=Paenibacillus turpanensis TaxID=2689078 RepID=UPI001408D4BF|nr:hypothetical protein [Paenibacillus turpanensis]